MSQPKRSVFVQALAAIASPFYRIGVNFRNFLFNSDILKSRQYAMPIISVGNITVRGTGKTPHAEFILSFLSPKIKVALLSRGYKRKSVGYVLANENSTAEDLGDEPYQIHKKFPDIYVAVDKDRMHAIEILTKEHPEVGVAVMDDGYQYRYIEPGLNILLIDYNRPMHEDSLLPLGQLREPIHNKSRANLIIVTKCPDNATPMDYRLIQKHINPSPYQPLYFSKIEYGELYPMDEVGEVVTKKMLNADKYGVLVLTGIEDGSHLAKYISGFADTTRTISFPDHHNYTAEDIKTIQNAFEKIPNDEKIIVTTEKDSARLSSSKFLDEELKSRIYVLPIEVKILFDKEEEFKKLILDYVKKNTTNNRLSQKTDRH